MTDKKDEYQFPEEERTKDYAPQPTSPLARLLQNKRMLFILIAVSVLYTGLQFFMGHSDDKTAQETTHAVAQTPATTTPVHTQVVSLPPATLARPTESATTAAPSGTVGQLIETAITLKKELNDVQQQSAAYRARINQLVGELNSVNAALNTLKTTVSTLRASQTDMEARFKKMTAKPRPRTIRRAATPSLTYTVKALVPGRAWLQASNGRLMTVKIGDTLPRYGVVRTISPERGQLITSRGTVIRYGPDE